VLYGYRILAIILNSYVQHVGHAVMMANLFFDPKLFLRVSGIACIHCSLCQMFTNSLNALALKYNHAGMTVLSVDDIAMSCITNLTAAATAGMRAERRLQA